MRMTKQGRELVKEFEGLRLKSYKCPAGVWTIGYGTTRYFGEVPVGEGEEIDTGMAETLFAYDLRQFGTKVRPLLREDTTDNQYSALVSLAYNIGLGAFKRSSARRYHNMGQFSTAADKILLWRKGGGKVLPGLVRRRKAERELYLSD